MVDITDDADGANSTTNAREVLVGEQVKLSVTDAPLFGYTLAPEFPLPLPTVYSWNVPGKTIGSYYVAKGSSEGMPTPMLWTPLSSSVSFDWVDGLPGGATKTVSVGVNSAWGPTGLFANFTVYRPDVQTTASALTPVPQVYFTNTIDKKEIGFGSPKNPPVGMVWSATMLPSARNAANWQYCYVQIVNARLVVVSSKNVNPSAGWTVYKCGGPLSGLDKSFPYAGNYPYPGTISTDDSPYATIERGGFTLQISSFTAWLMCEPVGKVGDWVPLQQISWGCMALSTWSSGAWPSIVTSYLAVDGNYLYETAPKPGGFALNPRMVGGTYGVYAFQDTTSFPTWSTIVTATTGRDLIPVIPWS